MKSCFFLLLLMTGVTFAAEEPLVLRIHGETTYTVEYPTWAGFGHDQAVIADRHRGTGFLARSDAGPFIITAAHVVTGSWPVSTLTTAQGKTLTLGGTTILRSAVFRIRIGDLALVPQEIAIDHDHDLAALRLSPADLDLVNVRALLIDAQAPVMGKQLRAWGFPETAAPQLSRPLEPSEALGGLIVLNGSLAAGSSGGPVLLDDQVIGVVSRSDGQQTRVVDAAQIIRLIASFERLRRTYADNLLLSGGATDNQ